ncbi:MAG: hypothetical protein GIW98_05640 [Candidatus Eremiobacteraeota bacterium]|nr:hypothetical protein [Candidatus Eremiobacteraeota bacterium]
MERRDVYENELTEEDRPPGDEQEDVAETERLDPDTNTSGDQGKDMKDDIYGQNEKK